MGAISAIDIALYDIAGKYFQVPVYDCPGRANAATRVRVYNHTAGRTEEELVANAVKGRIRGLHCAGASEPLSGRTAHSALCRRQRGHAL